MKNLSFILISLLFCFLSMQYTLGQDKIFTTDGSTIFCDLLKINTDTVFFNTDYKGKKLKTFLLAHKIANIEIKVLESIKSSLDTCDYTIKLDNQMVYVGKISSIDSLKIILKDRNNTKFSIDAETIVDFSKSNGIQYYLISLKDGTEIYGKLIKTENNEIELESSTLGNIKIKMDQIKEMVEVQKVDNNQKEYWFPNPNETRYLFGPSGYNLKAGEGYYQNIYAFFNMANVGITDYFSIGGGVEILSTFSGSPTIVITPKFGFPVSKKVQLGVGAIAGLLGGESTGGIIYGVGTYGNKDHNLTLGLGYAFFEDEVSKKPVLTFSGMTRLGKKTALISENWIISTSEDVLGIFSYGIRLFGQKMSFDIALLNNAEIFEEIPIGIPFVDFVYKF